jgi:hypothetical protein
LVAAACSTSGDDAAEPHGDAGATSSTTSPYGQGWTAVHADSANSDYAPVDGADDVTLAWQRSLGGGVNLGPTIDADGRVYVTTAAPGCHLYVLEAATGETIWCSEDVDRFAVASAALLDDEGRAFLADSEAMHAFGTDGNVLWETPIVGVPLSAQFTPRGRVIFITHIGRIYVLDRATGEPVLAPVELIPGATFDPATNMRGCLLGTAECPSANTPAIDLETGRLFFTFWEPGAPQAGIRAMQVSEPRHLSRRLSHLPQRQRRQRPRPRRRDRGGDLELPDRLRDRRQPVDLAGRTDPSGGRLRGEPVDRADRRGRRRRSGLADRHRDQSGHRHPGRGRQGVRHSGRGTGAQRPRRDRHRHGRRARPRVASGDDAVQRGHHDRS